MKLHRHSVELPGKQRKLGKLSKINVSRKYEKLKENALYFS